MPRKGLKSGDVLPSGRFHFEVEWISAVDDPVKVNKQWLPSSQLERPRPNQSWVTLPRVNPVPAAASGPSAKFGLSIEQNSTSTVKVKQAPAEKAVKATSVVCEICSKKLRSNKNLESHFESFHASKTCEECGITLMGSRSLKTHEIRNHGRRFKAKTGFKCSICGKMLTSKPNLDGHYHSFHRKVTCPHCNVTVFGRNVRRHMRRAHREKYVEENPTRKCLSCNKTLIATYYQRHVKMFHQNFTCLQCDLRFTGERSYLDHFAAGKCGKSGVSEENFDLELEDDVLTTKDVNINGGWAPGENPMDQETKTASDMLLKDLLNYDYHEETANPSSSSPLWIPLTPLKNLDSCL